MRNNIENYPKIVVDERGYLRVKMPSGDMLPETELKISNTVQLEDKNLCEVTVTFEAVHNLTNKE